jgi:hypothetical protein
LPNVQFDIVQYKLLLIARQLPASP